MNTSLIIPAGGMYQEWMRLIDLVEEDTAKMLETIAAEDGWHEVQPTEAFEMGFEELVNWSNRETDILVLVGSDFLVCLPKDRGAYS